MSNPILAAESVSVTQAKYRMHRQVGSPATAWQTAQSNTTSFDRAAPTSERDLYAIPETIALNSQSEQSLRDAVEIKSNPHLGSVALTNERSSKILQTAHLAIADQSPFNLRNTDTRVPIRGLNLNFYSSEAPRAVAEVNPSSVSVPLPPRTTYDASGNLVPRPEDVRNLSLNNALDLPSSLKAASQAGSIIDAERDTQSYRGVSKPYSEALTQRDIQPFVPTAPDNLFPQKIDQASFNASPESFAQTATAAGAGVSIDASNTSHGLQSFDQSHINAAWGLPDESVASKGTLNSLFPGVGGSSKRASVSFDAGMPASKTGSALSPDSNNSKAIKAGDALHTGRMGTSSARFKDTNRLQTCSSLPLFDTNSMRSKFQADNVTFSKSISPNGERIQVQTAPDFSSITEVWTPAANGTYLYKSVYRDELNRVRYEESVSEQGLRTIVQTGYCDREDKKSPFVAYKMMIKPDGTRELLS